MNVRTLASGHVHFVAPGDTIDRAITLMEEHDIRHLPVVSDYRPVGMVSDRDVLLRVGWKLACERGPRTLPGWMVGPRSIDEIMHTPVLTIEADVHPVQAAIRMVRERIGALPVVHDERMTGLISQADLARILLYPAAFGAGVQTFSHRPASAIMRARVRTLESNATVADAMRLLRDHHIRHVPIVAARGGDQARLMGMISDRDIRRLLGEAAVGARPARGDDEHAILSTPVERFMSIPVLTAGPDEPVSGLVRQMLDHHIHAMPIVSGGGLMGIVSQTDVLRGLTSCWGEEDLVPAG